MIYFYVHTSYQSNGRLISRVFYSLQEMTNSIIHDGFIPAYWLNDCNVRFYCEDDGIMEIDPKDIIARM